MASVAALASASANCGLTFIPLPARGAPCFQTGSAAARPTPISHPRDLVAVTIDIARCRALRPTIIQRFTADTVRLAVEPPRSIFASGLDAKRPCHSPLARWHAHRSSADTATVSTREQTMMRSIMLAALVVAGFSTASTKEAGAVVYCTYVGYPSGCVARAGVVLRPRPVARTAVRHNAGGNANGGVNRAGARR